MKKTILLVTAFVLVFGVFAAIPAAASDSELYYINVPILKIFPHKLGYYVIYRRAGLKTGEAFIPHKWFDRRDSRAVLNLTGQNINPYLTIMMRNGKFDHVRVVAMKDTMHGTWGTLADNAIDDSKFNIETLNLEF